MAIFNTLLLNCFLLPLFNPPVRYLGLPHPFHSLPPIPYHLQWQTSTIHTHTYVHTYVRQDRPEVATCKLHPELSTCQFHRVLVLLC